MARRNRSCGRE